MAAHFLAKWSRRPSYFHKWSRRPTTSPKHGGVAVLFPFILRFTAIAIKWWLYLYLFLQVGKVSMEWLAGEKTKVAGTFPPRKREWTGYVEKDTAGQTNIYAVEVHYLIYY